MPGRGTSSTKRRRTAAALLCALTTAGGVLATATDAHASGANWSDWSGNCYGWTTWDTNHVTGHTWDHATDDCRVTIIQWSSTAPPGSGSSYVHADAYAPDTGASTPTWWHGPASSGGVLEDQVCVQDLTTGSAITCSGVYA